MQQQNHNEALRTFTAEDPKLREMARIIARKINSLVNFPLSAEQVEDWVMIIDELMPWVDPQHLNKTVNQFLRGGLEWDPGIGVKNLLHGALRTKRDKSQNKPI